MCLAAAAIIMVQTYVKNPGSRQYAALNAADMEMAVNKVRSGEMSINPTCVCILLCTEKHTSQPRQRCS